MKIFQDVTFLLCIFRLVSIIVAIPVYNAFIKRIFSLCNGQLTKERNSLDTATVKSLVQVKPNFAYLMSCFILRSKVRGCEKYK
jgi:uncharacterized membrane protein (GlpM family)